MRPEPELALRALVTGAGGLVGRHLVAHLANASAISLGAADWRSRVEAADYREATVIHLAARVHRSGDSDAEFTHDNVEKTRVLAASAAEGGARRFVFLSTIKVNGEETRDRPFHAGDPAAPEDAYARSKWAAEQALAEMSRTTRLPLVIVRSPLVIGEGASANLRSLLRLADTFLPLPFAAIANRRSLVPATDLARLLCLCATAPQAEGRTYLAAHPDAVSTAHLVRALRGALGRPARLVAVAPSLLEAGAACLGLRDSMRRLTRSLEVDASETVSELGWRVSSSLDEALSRMARAYRLEKRAQ